MRDTSSHGKRFWTGGVDDKELAAASRGSVFDQLNDDRVRML